MANGVGPRQKRAFAIATAALENIQDQIRKQNQMPLLEFHRGVVYAVLVNLALQLDPEPEPDSTQPPSPL